MVVTRLPAVRPISGLRVAMDRTTRKLVLHAGFAKTGSSAIQNYLFNYFTHPGFRYLHWNKPNSSLVVRRAFKVDIPIYRNPRTSDQDKRKIRHTALKNMRRKIEVHEAPTDILSAEDIERFDLEELKNLSSFLFSYYEKISVHLYVRPLKSHMESVFQERLKNSYISLRELRSKNLEVAARILDESFGKENVKFHKYDRACFPSGDIVAHFLSQIGIEFHSSFSAEVNSALSLPAVKLLYMYRSVFPHKIDADAARIQQLSELAGPDFRIHSELFNQLRTWPPETAEWFEHRAGFSISEDFSANDQIAVSSEEELLSVSEDTVDWLNSTLSKMNSGHSAIPNNAAALAEGVRKLG